MLCLVLPLLTFAGMMEIDVFKRILIWITLVYFAAGVGWIGQREEPKPPSD